MRTLVWHQLVFCLTLTITLVTSAGWKRGHPANDRTLQTLTAITVVATYVQILIGATMRHTGAGLAIPDFPLAFGHVIPPSWSAAIAIHYAHRVCAVVVSFLVVATAGHVLYHHRERTELRRPTLLLLTLLAVQITLGALTVLSSKR